jgi:phosphoglycolate phosphatase
VLDATRAYAGIPEVVERLRARGLALGVVSNKPHPLTVAVVERLFPEGTFGMVFGEREGIPRKPDPAGAIEMMRALGVSRSEGLFVGDTPIDIATARAAGMPSVAVAWGFRSVAELRACHPTHVVQRPQALLDLV